jgi:hypothetical protein
VSRARLIASSLLLAPKRSRLALMRAFLLLLVALAPPTSAGSQLRPAPTAHTNNVATATPPCFIRSPRAPRAAACPRDPPTARASSGRDSSRPRLRVGALRTTARIETVPSVSARPPLPWGSFVRVGAAGHRRLRALVHICPSGLVVLPFPFPSLFLFVLIVD